MPSSAPAHERTPQLLTLVGVPGIGKSRLVYELYRIVDAEPELVTWRQGRCLAYGDGVTLWALGEIVKAQVGIVEKDSTTEIAAKVHDAVLDTLAGTGDEGRVEAQLLALLGLGEEAQLGGDDRRNEAFAAWRRFLEGMAEQRPLVLVFEDIHWADETLLDFVGRARRLGDGRAAARPRDRSAGAARAAARLGRRQAQRHDARSLATD